MGICRFKSKEQRDVDRTMRENGYVIDRCRGSHYIYTNGVKTISIPGSANKMLMKRLIKENNLMEV